ncbi:glucose 1-dehydrogenase [Aureobasidium pullulans EXF-150]|uniref:Glucose 1-dehydrogenase n=1 Tax=Aureobasidium pullulans EXF-150 TaxID=1043002 RepID=A0A074Y175_AURPU|nr:glucose 1-dehydrogenase [Aureobasidium pullulans EXF-150]KEQ87967.1 glucose 1-dehydrogenase [Aureobasidium pullulans EXF-150]
MVKKRVLVGYGVDVDAVSGWINTKDGTPQNGTNVSRGIFGATVGLERLLKLFNKHNIKATFFTPAHTIESFPKQLAKVKDAGHEIGLHGYTHEHISGLTATQQRDVLAKSIDVLTSFTGLKPKGHTAPAWDTSKELIPLLEEFGIIYDHSFMHHDLQPYFAPDGRHSWVETDVKKEASSWMKPMTKIKPSEIVEIPANWHVDDWPPLQPMPGRAGTHGFISTHELEKLWLEQFDYAYEEYDTFIFPMSIHPQVSGKPHVIKMHERIIEYINKHEGVEWMPLGDMATEFLEGRIAGVEIEGGADN